MKIAFAVFLVCVIGELLYPRILYRKGGHARVLRNLALGGIHRLIVTPFVLVPLIAAAAMAYHGAPSHLARLGWVGFPLSFLLLDFTNYFTHWLGHRVPFFWRFHAVHHLDNRLDVTTGLRVHAAEKILFLAIKLAVILSFGIPLLHVAMIEVITFCNGIFHHSNIRLPRGLESALAWVITVPSFHAIHHHSELPYTDSNYGFVLSIWDRVFGTLSPGEPQGGVQPGVNARVLDRVPESLSELFFQPFVGPLAGTTVEEYANETQVR